jgi:hypothetical protein
MSTAAEAKRRNRATLQGGVSVRSPTPVSPTPVEHPVDPGAAGDLRPRRGHERGPDGSGDEFDDDAQDEHDDRQRHPALVVQGAQGVRDGQPDSADSDIAEQHRGAQVDVEAVQGRGDELRHERLRDRGEDLLGAAAAEGLDRFAGSVVELFDGIGVELADHPHRMDAHGDDACRGAEAEHPQEHDGEHEVGNRSGEDDEGARRPLRTAAHPGGASGEEGDGDREHDGEQSRQEHDRQGLDDKRDCLTERPGSRAGRCGRRTPRHCRTTRRSWRCRSRVTTPTRHRRRRGR